VCTEAARPRDFSAFTSCTCRVLQITQNAYVEAKDAALTAKQDGALDVSLSKNTRPCRNRDGIGRSSGNEPLRSWLKLQRHRSNTESFEHSRLLSTSQHQYRKPWCSACCLVDEPTNEKCHPKALFM
jgi:hypothetical protein